MFTIESSETTNAPAAAIHLVIPRTMARGGMLSAAASHRRPRREGRIGLPAPRPRPPVGREDLAALHRQERDHRPGDGEARAQDVVDHPVTFPHLEDRD